MRNTKNIKRRLKRLLLSYSNLLPLLVWEKLLPQDVISPFYHIISDNNVSHLRHYSYKNSKQFELDVKFAQIKYKFISHEELSYNRLNNLSAKPNRFLFTFDDGLKECYTVARPILKRYNATAVFFVTTDFIDNKNIFYESQLGLCLSKIITLSIEKCTKLYDDFSIASFLNSPSKAKQVTLGNARYTLARIPRPASKIKKDIIIWLLGLNIRDQQAINQLCDYLDINWNQYLNEYQPYLSEDQIKQLASDGFTIGGHGISHGVLQELSNNQIEKEIVDSCKILKDITGQKKIPFSFPYGGSNLDMNHLMDILKRYDFIDLLYDTTSIRKNIPFIVNRFWADFPSVNLEDKSNLPKALGSFWCNMALNILIKGSTRSRFL